MNLCFNLNPETPHILQLSKHATPERNAANSYAVEDRQVLEQRKPVLRVGCPVDKK